VAVAVALIAEVVACVMRPVPAVSPVTLPVNAPIKPFVDVTGPEKVVDAMIFPYMQVGAYLSACRQPGLSDTPESPE